MFCRQVGSHSSLFCTQDWVVLGALDLDEFAFNNLHDLSDWERNFKGLKARGRDAEKLPRYHNLCLIENIICPSCNNL